MSEMKHTPEPWACYNDGRRERNNVSHFIESLAGDLITYGHLSEEDARRIVACVNACEGIDTNVLELGRMSPDAFHENESRADKAERQVTELERQHAVLVEALEEVVQSAVDYASRTGDRTTWLDRATAALAAVKPAGQEGGAS